MAAHEPRTVKIDLRLASEARADESLPDRRHFSLDAEQWTAFMAALDASPQSTPRLRRLLDEPSAFE
jgi:uncharacterized protein (DUF1778 family)